ncbi:MAG: iron ABC transporter permease [Bdellovibrionota bacterium]|nr:iron ABC transporter permease [Bdellovibrionota bacterium]
MLKSFPLTFILLLGTLTFSTFLSFKAGGVEQFSWGDIFHFFNGESNNFVLSELRLPRILLCWVVGPLLATSGVLFQSLTKNPLGSPDILGVNSVGSFMGIFFILYFSFLPTWLLPFSVFMGGLFCGFLIYFLSSRKNISSTKLAIIGVAIHILFSSLIQLLISLKSLEIQTALTWLAGSFWGKGMEELKWPFLFSLGLVLMPYFFIKKINVLIFDDETIIGLGENLSSLKFVLLILAVLCSSLAVSLTGPVGFIALLAPQMARNLTENKIQKILPVSCFISILLLLWADGLGRSLFSPLEIPVGVVTCFLGAPTFFFILMRKSRLEKRRGTSW